MSQGRLLPVHHEEIPQPASFRAPRERSVYHRRYCLPPRPAATVVSLHRFGPTPSLYIFLLRLSNIALLNHVLLRLSVSTGFGISSQFWDHIFGTAIALKKLSRCLKWY